MTRGYEVAWREGVWIVFFREYNNAKEKVYEKFIDTFKTKVEADFRADRGNLIVEGAEKKFKEDTLLRLVGVR